MSNILCICLVSCLLLLMLLPSAGRTRRRPIRGPKSKKNDHIGEAENQTGSAEESTNCVLFVIHDAGETLALRPVVQKLSSVSSKWLPVLVLPLGEPATSITSCQGNYTKDCKILPHISLADMGIDVDIIDGPSGRTQLLTSEQLAKLTHRLASRISVVVTGMNIAMQNQIGVGLQKRGSKYAAYYDGLSVVGTDPDSNIGGTQAAFAQHANQIWVPSLILRPEGSEWLHDGTTWHAVGQPTLEKWATLAKDVEALREVRRRIYGEEAVEMGDPAVVWFGGYGVNYEKSLRIWCKAIRHIQLPGLRFSLATHPGLDGNDDRRVLQEEHVDEMVAIVPSDISGALAALASNLTVSQGSTGGEQSLFAGKAALFVDPSKNPAFGQKLGTMLGLIRTVKEPALVVAEVERISELGWAFDPSRLADAGVPLHATTVIQEHVMSLLRLVVV